MTYTELFQTAPNGVLLGRITAAVAIAANTINSEDGGTTNHANRLLWAKSVCANPAAEANRIVWMVLAQNAGITVASLMAATDAQVQTAVNNVINLFATGS